MNLFNDAYKSFFDEIFVSFAFGENFQSKYDKENRAMHTCVFDFIDMRFYINVGRRR